MVPQKHITYRTELEARLHAAIQSRPTRTSANWLVRRWAEMTQPVIIPKTFGWPGERQLLAAVEARGTLDAMKADPGLLNAALHGYMRRLEEIDQAILEIRARLKAQPATGTPAPRRKLSAASRRKMAAAQKKRWAEYKKSKGSK